MKIHGKQITDAVSSDASPSLSANLDVGTSSITTSTSNGNVKLEPNGSGVIEIRGASSNDGVLQLNCSQNSHGVKIKSPPHSAAASYTLTLPNDDGSANQVLKTDGSGGLSWVDQSGGASDTDALSEGTSNLYFTNARADARIAAASLKDVTDVDFTAGSGIDNYVLTYDHSGGKWGAEASSTGASRPSIYDVSSATTIGNDTAISSSELERIYIVDSSSAAVTLTLPEITGDVGEGYKLQVKRDGANNVTITANAADKIENGSDGGSEVLTEDKNSFTLVCANTPANKTNWYII